MTEVTSDLRVHMRHIRKERLCANGARTWFKGHDIPWGDFLTNGVPAKVLADTGDALALRVVAAAKAEQDGR